MATSSKQKPRKKITYVPKSLPPEGFVRLCTVLAVLNISRTSFLNGVKTGKYPAGKLLSTRCRVWEVSTIRSLLASIGGERVACPVNEIEALNKARIAGKTEDEIKTLVIDLEAARVAV